MTFLFTQKQQPNRFALFNLGFRPFFLGAGGFSVLTMVWWLLFYGLQQSFLLNVSIPPSLWHAHSMIYGYAMAVIAGFLLTAVKNWTGVSTIYGWQLGLLFFNWFFARLFSLIPWEFSLLVMLVADMSFMFGLIVAIIIPIIKVKQWAQLGIVSKMILLLFSNGLFYAGVFGRVEQGMLWGIYSGFYLIIALIMVMARRVIPFFIEKGVGSPVTLSNWKWLDMSSLVLYFAFMILVVFFQHSDITAVLAGLLFILHSMRLWGWYANGLWQKPLLWSLYLAYSFIVLGFLLYVLAWVYHLSLFLAIHAFAVGGIGMMTMSMMSRVAWGHTGRDVINQPPKISIWVLCLLFAVIARVILPLIAMEYYLQWIILSQVLWIFGFAGFVWKFLPILTKPRVDLQFG